MHKSITQEQSTQEKLRPAERLFHEANLRLQNAIKTKGMGEITVVQRRLDVAYPNMEAFTKKKEVVDDTQRRKVTDKIVASVLTKNK